MMIWPFRMSFKIIFHLKGNENICSNLNLSDPLGSLTLVDVSGRNKHHEDPISNKEKASSSMLEFNTSKVNQHTFSISDDLHGTLNRNEMDIRGK